MKKVITMIITLALLSSVSFAEVDLSGMSFADLAALRDQIQLEMMSRDEWQEVTVPQGLWEVGKEIPAGTWLVRCADIGLNSYMMRECDFSWGAGKPNNNNHWESKNRKGSISLYNPNHEDYAEGQLKEYIVTLEAGDFVYISPAYNRAVFTTYTGVPSFQFK